MEIVQPVIDGLQAELAHANNRINYTAMILSRIEAIDDGAAPVESLARRAVQLIANLEKEINTRASQRHCGGASASQTPPSDGAPAGENPAARSNDELLKLTCTELIERRNKLHEMLAHELNMPWAEAKLIADEELRVIRLLNKHHEGWNKP
jgi:hypothetical protein